MVSLGRRFGTETGPPTRRPETGTWAPLPSAERTGQQTTPSALLRGGIDGLRLHGAIATRPERGCCSAGPSYHAATLRSNATQQRCESQEKLDCFGPRPSILTAVAVAPTCRSPQLGGEQWQDQSHDINHLERAPFSTVRSNNEQKEAAKIRWLSLSPRLVSAQTRHA